ncbi:MAG: hypothetical protein HOW73_02280 [Polyangiaceae bacterium]|nr:hypothetical protein [Polyangiaceae bacterium]
MKRHSALLAALLLSTFAASSGCRQVLDLPETVECGSDDSCNTPDKPCLDGQCIDGVCAYSWKPEGTVVDAAEEDDCANHVCDANGEIVIGLALDDAPADDTAGDCRTPSCGEDGSVTFVANDDDAPSEDAPGDCVRPVCNDGTVAAVPSDDPPTDTIAFDCSSPACDEGTVVDVPNNDDKPRQDIDGDCLSIECDSGMPKADDDDRPTSGCGGCLNGAVVAWEDLGESCYTADQATENVGLCVPGTWTCDASNNKVCEGQVVPAQEECGLGHNGIDEDCDGENDECGCALGDSVACYFGPPNTENVGICQGGTSTCEATAEGNVFGDCIGEVQPQVCDSCVQAGDQDCSGSNAPCTGGHAWTRVVGTPQFEFFSSLAQLPTGNVMVQLPFDATITVGGTTVTSDGSRDVLVAEFDLAGNAVSARAWGGNALDDAGFLTSLDDGYALAMHLGPGSSENFGSGPTLTGANYKDGVIAKFDSNHTVQWKRHLAGSGPVTVVAAARMPDNGIVACGTFSGSLDVGGATLNSAGDDDIFVVRYNASGTHVWSKRFGTTLSDTVSSIAAAPNSDVLVVGDFTSSISFGGPILTGAGGTDGYVARLDANGNHVWTRGIQSASDERAQKVVALSDGTAWVGGWFQAAVNADGQAGPDISPTSTGKDILLVKYDAVGGLADHQEFNNTGSTSINAMSVGYDDSIAVAGDYNGTLYFSGAASPSLGAIDAFIFKIGPTGTLYWSRKPATTYVESFEGVHVGACGDVFGSARFHDPINFGGGNVTSTGDADIAVVRYLQ